MNESTPPERTRRQILGLTCTGIAVGVGTYLGMPNEGQPNAKQATPSTSSTPVPSPAAPQAAYAQQLPDREIFIPQIGTNFNIKLSVTSSANCKLLEVSPATVMETAKGTFTAFTLLFARELGFLHEGGICVVTHPALEKMEIFLSPVGDAKKQPLLEACFTVRA